MFKFSLYFIAGLGPKFQPSHIRELSSHKRLYIMMIRNDNIVNIYTYMMLIPAYKENKNKNDKVLNNS